MNEYLDLTTVRDQVDPSGMWRFIEGFPDQCRFAEKQASEFPLPQWKKLDHVVICGMGGSAIGGDLFRAYASPSSPIPIEVVHRYSLPAYVGKHTLVIPCSYSGNTEETLSCYQEAKERKAHIMAITSGGTLEQWCRGDGNVFLRIPEGYPPRSALGFSFIPLVIFFEAWGLLPYQTSDLRAMHRVLKEGFEKYETGNPVDNNPAKQLAIAIHGAIPVIYAAQDAFEPVAVRWQTQFNENSKTFSHVSAVPEMNHNEILGWTHPFAGIKKLHILFLQNRGNHRQIDRRFLVMKNIFATAGHKVTEVECLGNVLLARMMSMIQLGDFTSLYLAYLYKQDPTPISAIDRLKNEMGKFEH